DLLADLQERDFTINAIALPITADKEHELIDPTGGQADLQAGLVRMVHEQSLAHDPVRVLRALRLTGQLGFALTPETAVTITTVAPQLATVSVERIRDELLKILATAVPHHLVQQMQELGILPVVLPVVAALDGITQSPPHWQDVLAHTINVLAWLVQVETAVLAGAETAVPALSTLPELFSPYRAQLNEHFERTVEGMVNGRVLLYLSALFHDVGKRDTQTVAANGQIHFYGHDKVGARITSKALHQLTLSNKASSHVANVVEGHMRPLLLVQSQGNAPTRRAIYRFFRDIQSAGLDVGLLALADHLATYDGAGDAKLWETLVQLVTTLYQTYFEQHRETVAPVPLLSGHDLIQLLQLKPGPEIGRLLRLLEEAQAAGEVATREEAIQFIQQSRQ
ncbi:MAG: HDIG domain-containing protein, partial [Anaerolineales bacterium]|nr:HDIG domain-containing protein [Anaerolineales bacterium]